MGRWDYLPLPASCQKFSGAVSGTGAERVTDSTVSRTLGSGCFGGSWIFIMSYRQVVRKTRLEYVRADTVSMVGFRTPWEALTETARKGLCPYAFRIRLEPEHLTPQFRKSKWLLQEFRILEDVSENGTDVVFHRRIVQFDERELYLHVSGSGDVNYVALIDFLTVLVLQSGELQEFYLIEQTPSAFSIHHLRFEVDGMDGNHLFQFIFPSAEFDFSVIHW